MNYKIIRRLSTTIPIEISANAIKDEDYWKRLCVSKKYSLEEHGMLYKQYYIESYVQNLFEGVTVIF
jgi:hypothetical protein